ncbi:MAG: M24 family metallopeptidase [Planctomycetaceae bacterium]
MITEQGCLARREALWQRIPAEFDTALITARPHLMYLAGFEASATVFNSQASAASLILTREGDAVLVADNAQEPFSRAAFVPERGEPLRYRCGEAAPHRGQLLGQTTAEWLRSRSKSGLAIEFSHTPWLILAGMTSGPSPLRLHDLDADLRALRKSKHPDEQAQIRECLRVAGEAVAATRRDVRPGMTGLDLYRLVLRVASEVAGRPVHVYGDFVSGPGAEAGGGPASNRSVQSGDLVLLDYSVVINGYRGDFCTTFVCDGTPTSRQREMHAACMAVLESARTLLQPGRTGRDVYAACRAPLESAGLGNHFPHHAGHGIGLGHPEPPYLVPESDERLEVGDVVTLEPGLYIPGVGGMRFEHNYIVTQEGPEQISHHSLSLDN